MKVVLDYNYAKKADKPNIDTGLFTCIYKGEVEIIVMRFIDFVIRKLIRIKEKSRQELGEPRPQTWSLKESSGREERKRREERDEIKWKRKNSNIIYFVIFDNYTIL